MAGKYAIPSRRAMTQVAVSKLVDIYGNIPSYAIKVKVSTWFAELTQMAASDFFDPKTHKGFLNKDLENRRRKLPAEEKRWVWSKKLRIEEINVNEESDQATGISMDSLPSISARAKNFTAM